MSEGWIRVLELVGPSAAAVLAMVILVVPIVYALLRFLRYLLELIAKGQERDIKTARVLERLCVTLAGMPSLVGAEVADVIRRDRADSLDPDAPDEYRLAAMRAELDAAQNLSDEEACELACAEIRRRYSA